MTREAQMALRRIIELYAHNNRFILLSNDVSNIIEAIQSRSVILKFSRIIDVEISQVLQNISEKENFSLSSEICKIICLAANGDLKQSINYLQIFSKANKTDLNSFYQIFNLPPLISITTLIQKCLKNETQDAYQIIQELLNNGYNVSDILDILLKVICTYEMDPYLRILYIKAINRCFYLTETSNSISHLYYLISRLNLIPRN